MFCDLDASVTPSAGKSNNSKITHHTIFPLIAEELGGKKDLNIINDLLPEAYQRIDSYHWRYPCSIVARKQGLKHLNSSFLVADRDLRLCLRPFQDVVDQSAPSIQFELPHPLWKTACWRCRQVEILYTNVVLKFVSIGNENFCQTDTMP